MSSPPIEVQVLADRPDLIDQVGALRWQEWGYGEPDPESWIGATAAEAGRDRLPVTLVAVSRSGEAVGAVALGDSDNAMNVVERDGRSPWLLGLVVRQQDRHRGVGRMLVTALGRLAARHGHSRVWVATGGEAVGFYRRCHWQESEQLRLVSTGIATTVLTRDLEGGVGA